MSNKVELTPYTGVNYRGDVIEFDQWNVVLNGRKVGLLSHKPNTRLMPTTNLPDELWEEVCIKCEELRKPQGEVLRPFPIYVPPQAVIEQQEEVEVDE